MATSKGRITVSNTTSWTDVSGAAASVAGVTWQNVGKTPVAIAFTAAEPVEADAISILNPAQAFYDINGSAKIWAKPAGLGAAVLSATAD